MLSLLPIRLDLCLRTVLCLVLATTAVAQHVGGAHDAWRWTQFTEDDGLPSSRVARILETKAGVSWAVTERGLAWFDDYEWHVAVGLPELRPSSVALHAELLFAVTDGVLYRGDPSGFAPVDIVFPGLVRIDGVEVCADGSLMLEAECEDRSRLLHFDHEQVQLPPPNHGEFPRPIRNLYGAGGEVFVCHSQGIDRWVGGAWQLVLSTDLQPQISASVASSQRAAILLRGPVTHRGLWRWEGSGQLRRSVVPTSARLRSVAMLGEELCCLDALGAVFVQSGGAWKTLTSVPFETGAIQSLGSRADGGIWFASERGAVLYLRTSKRWEFRASSEDSDLNFVHEIVHAKDGSLWLATLGGLVHEVEGKRRVYHELCGYRLHNLTGLAEDAAGDIWVSSGSGFKGVLRRSGSEWKHYGLGDGLLAEHVHKIRADRSGGLWYLGIGARDKPKSGPGAFRFDGLSFLRAATPAELPSNRVYDFAEGEDGARWFATYSGVARWASDGSFRTWPTPGGHRGEMAFAIDVDEGGLWFASRGSGVGRIEGDEIRFLTKADGLSSNRVWNVASDGDGGLWIATEVGLDYLRDGRVSSLGTALGLRRLWPLEIHDGRIYAGTMGRGYASFDLAALSSSSLRIRVFPLSESANPVIRWRTYAKGGIDSPDSIESRFRIDAGVWSRWGTPKSATLQDYPSGSYAFEIEARSLVGAGALARRRELVTVTAPLIAQPGVQWSLAVLSLLVVVLACSLWNRRHRHQIELAVRAEGYKDLFENAQELIYTLDLDGCFTSINRCAEERFGASRSELIGTRFADLVGDDGRARVETLRLKALDGATSSLHEFEIERVDSRCIWLEISNRAVKKSGRIVGTQNFARDITERRQLEQQLLHAQKMEAVGRLAGGIAHDFNNLLVVIKGFSEMLLTDLPDNSPSRKSLEQIRHAGQRAALLTRQLLAFSRKEVARPEVLDLSQSLSDMEDLIRRLVGADVELEVEIDPGELCVFADPSQMEQVVMNLIVNSRDAMPDGGLLSIELRECCQRNAHPGIHGSQGLPEGDYVCLSVTDTGAGMDEDVLARVFEPFFTTKEQGKGTGLGLSTVYGIVQQSGGQIDVQSNAGVGTRFTVSLPMSVESPSAKTLAAVADLRCSGSETILLVEDELAVRKFIRRSLEQRGYKLLEAEDGQAALDVARDYDGPIHVLLTDVVMPRMGGAELARQMAEERPATKILFLSGYPGNALAKHGFGDEVYLQKPFAIGDLTRKLREVVGRERRDSVG